MSWQDKLIRYWVKLGIRIKDQNSLFKEVNGLGSGEFSPTLFNHGNENYHAAIDDVLKAKYGSSNYETSVLLKQNSSNFSAFKSAQFTELFKGKSKEEKEAILSTYQRQLTTELNLVTRSSRSAKQWNEIQRTKDIYPNIEYRRTSSANPDGEHLSLVGTILPIDDPFWDNYMPPSRYGCKCTVAKSDSDIKPPSDLPKLEKGISGNAGKSGQIFTPNHPFVANVNTKFRGLIQRQLEGLKLTSPYGILDYKKGSGTINVNPFADKKDLDKNFIAAKSLISVIKGLKIQIRPHVNNVKTGFGLSNRANPEYLINGKAADLKTINSNNFSNRFRSAKNQGAKMVIFEISEEMSIERAFQLVNGQIKLRNGNPFERIFILQGKKAIEYK